MSHPNVIYLATRGWQGKEARGNILGNCPHRDHPDKHPSFSINAMTGQFKCFSCGFKGNSLVTLMMGVEGISIDEARDKVYGVKDISLEDTPRDTYLSIMEHTQKWFAAAIKAKKEPLSVLARNARTYLNNRGVTDQLIDKYGIGLSQEGVVQYLAKKGLYQDLFKLTQFIAEGSYICGDRVTVPVIYRGKVIGFSMRTLVNDDRKYLTLVNADLFPSHQWFFNLDNVTGDTVIVTEGVFDAIATGGVAMLGTALSPDRIALLYRFKNIYLMFDNDAGGWKAVEDFFFYSRGILPHSVVKVCDMPKDPDEITGGYQLYMNKALPITHWIARKMAQHKDPEVMCNEVRRIRERADNTYEMNDVEKALLDQYLLTECALMRFAPKLWGGDKEWSRAWSEMVLEVERITGIKYAGIKP